MRAEGGSGLSLGLGGGERGVSLEPIKNLKTNKGSLVKKRSRNMLINEQNGKIFHGNGEKANLPNVYVEGGSQPQKPGPPLQQTC